MVPSHSHIFEQTGFLISGKLIFKIDGNEHEVNPGDSWCIKGNVEHSALVPEETFLSGVFYRSGKIIFNKHN